MNYMPVRKKFIQGNYDANDSSGKKAVIKFLEKRGLSVKENPDKYGIDLIANGTTYNGKVFDNVPIEVERRNIWSRIFPYTTVHIPERKTKFLKDYMLYAVVNSEYDRILFCSSDKIKKYPLIEVSNKSIQKGEFFYDVPFKEWQIGIVDN